MLGVHSPISTGEVGCLRIRRVALVRVRHRWQVLLRRLMNSGGEDFGVILMLLRVLSERRECTVLSLLTSKVARANSAGS